MDIAVQNEVKRLVWALFINTNIPIMKPNKIIFPTKPPFVYLTKEKSLLEEAHPNGIEEGSDHKGYAKRIPTVGESFYIKDHDRWFCTSVVTEIIDDNTFKTLNSIYHWKIKS